MNIENHQLDLIDQINPKSTCLRFTLHYILKSLDGTETAADLQKAKAWLEREIARQKPEGK